MRKIFIVAVAAALTGCALQKAPEDLPGTEGDSGNKYRTVCIDGVQYWYYSRGNREGIAVRISAQTLQPIRC